MPWTELAIVIAGCAGLTGVFFCLVWRSVATGKGAALCERWGRWSAILLLLSLVAAGLSGCCSANPQSPSCNPWKMYRFEKAAK